MSTNHNRIKVVDLETNHPNKILKTNLDGELEFSDVENNFQPNLTDENFGAFQNSLQTVNTITDTDKMPFLIGSLARMMTWANFKSLFKTVGGNSIFGNGNIATPDMDTTTSQTVSGVKTFLNLMLGLRNAANTFTSFIASTATASRTWTFPDKSGTVAMTSDITGIINAGTANRIPKYVGSTVLGEGIIYDSGSYIGIGVANVPTKDLTLGNQSDKYIGVEDSDSTTIGRDLVISPGRTINFKLSSAFVSLGTSASIQGNFAIHPNGNVYVANINGTIYMQTAGSGVFSSLSQTTRSWKSMAAHSNGNVYATVWGGDIYIQTNGNGIFTPLGQTARNWNGIGVHPNGNVYATVDGGDIYIQTAGTGSFVALGQTLRNWTSISCAPNGNVYAAAMNDDIYLQTSGTGNFLPLGQTQAMGNWNCIHCAPNGNVYAGMYNNDLYMRTGDTGNFVKLTNAPNMNYGGLGIDANNSVYAGWHFGGDIMYQNNNNLGTPNLNGGKLKLRGGTAKGTGMSKVEFYTGQKLASGTNMQADTLRGYFDENGHFVYLTPPSYANDTDADADSNLPSKAFYKITGNRTLFQKP